MKTSLRALMEHDQLRSSGPNADAPVTAVPRRKREGGVNRGPDRKRDERDIPLMAATPRDKVTTLPG